MTASMTAGMMHEMNTSSPEMMQEVLSSFKDPEVQAKANHAAVTRAARRAANEADMVAKGQVVEVRGIVNKDQSVSFCEHTLYDNEFDLGSYVMMLEYYHGMCKELCCK